MADKEVLHALLSSVVGGQVEEDLVPEATQCCLIESPRTVGAADHDESVLGVREDSVQLPQKSVDLLGLGGTVAVQSTVQDGVHLV